MTTDEMHTLVESWELPLQKEDKKYSVNTVVDAYLKGVSDGKDQTTLLLKDQLRANFKKAGADSNKVVDFLKENNLSPISAHLKMCSLYEFTVLVTVKEEDFLSQNFIKVYDFTNSLEVESKTDYYSISFSFINKSPNFNPTILVSDGYALSLKSLPKPKA